MRQQDLDALNFAQADPAFHGYTCGNNSSHRPLRAGWIGWLCPECTYYQPYNGREIFVGENEEV